MGSRVLPAFAACAVCAIAACGSDHPPYLGDPSLPPPVDGFDAGGDPFRRDSGVKPGCTLGPEQGVCGCTELSLLGDPPNMYFVLDRSGSMNDSGKWSTIRGVVASVVSKLGPRIAVGAATFPKPSTDTCRTGDEVFALRRGDTPTAPGALSTTAADLLVAIGVTASGGTPTAATLTALLPKLQALGGKTFVVLATDGGPNCDPLAACDSSTCIANIESSAPECTPTGPNCCLPSDYGPEACLDAYPTTAAVIALQKAGIPVYVIGVPGSGPYAGLLDQLAVSGGTARPTQPYYYRVDQTDTAAFATAISQVAAKITATCTYTLSTPPKDQSQVNVYLDDVVLPADAANGWTIQGSTVTLVGDACNRVLAGDVLSVRIIEGCPTVLPN